MLLVVWIKGTERRNKAKSCSGLSPREKGHSCVSNSGFHGKGVKSL